MKITLCYTRGRGHSFFPLAAAVFSMKYCLCCIREATHPIVRLSDTSVWIWEPRATCWLYQWTSSCRFREVKGIEGQCLTQSPCFFLFIWWCEQMCHEKNTRVWEDRMTILWLKEILVHLPARESHPFEFYHVSLACSLGKLCTLVWFPWWCYSKSRVSVG